MADDSTFAADLSSALGGDTSPATPETSTAPADTSAPLGTATTQPADAAVPGTEPNRGPIPFEVHHTALENARKKVASEWEPYAWAKQVNREYVEQAVQIAQQYQTDPIAFAQELVQSLQSDPVHGPKLASLAARALAAQRQTRQGTQQTDGFPDPDVVITDGEKEVGRTYSGPLVQQIVTNAVTQALAKAREEFSPALQAHQSATLQAHADHFAHTQMQDADTWRGMDKDADKENRVAVGQRLQQLMAQVPHDQKNHPVVGPVLLQNALRQAYMEVVVPKLQTLERQAVAHELKQTANAGSVNPAKAGGTPPKTWEQMTTAEALQYAMSQAGGG